MTILNVLTAMFAAFSTVLFHPDRVLLTLAIFSPKWTLDLEFTVITTTCCVVEEAIGFVGYHQLISNF